jgi:hypothetical protein
MKTGIVSRIKGKRCDERRYITKIAKIAKPTKGQAPLALKPDDVSFVLGALRDLREIWSRIISTGENNDPGRDARRRHPISVRKASATASITRGQSPGDCCWNSRADGYQGLSVRFSNQRQH